MILRFVLQTAALHAPLQDWPPVGACSELQARVKKFHKRSGGKADFVPFVFADLRKCVARSLRFSCRFAPAYMPEHLPVFIDDAKDCLAVLCWRRSPRCVWL